MKSNVVGWLALCIGVVLVVNRVSAAGITVKGSDTMVVLAQRWAETYMAAHPEAKIQVTGGGTGTGFAALQNRTTDICNASRKIRGRETENCIKAFGRRPTEYRVALDGLSIYVNRENPVESLCLEQLEGIFTGRITNWRELGGEDSPITVYSRENSSGTYEFFKEHVLRGKDFAANIQMLQGTAQVLQAVIRDRQGIGYGGAGYGHDARVLRVAATPGGPAIEPSAETVLNGTYPISRYLFCYVNPAVDAGEVAAYLRWIRGDEGQRLVREVGFYPLPSTNRNVAVQSGL